MTDLTHSGMASFKGMLHFIEQSLKYPVESKYIQIHYYLQSSREFYNQLSMGAAIALSCDVTCAFRALTSVVVDYTIILQHCDQCLVRPIHGTCLHFFRPLP
jgi:predicted transcriptional regulator